MVITHKMFQILCGVANMPKAYRNHQRNVLKKDYKKALGNTYAFEVLEVLIGEKDEAEISAQGRACYRSVRDLVARVKTATS